MLFQTFITIAALTASSLVSARISIPDFSSLEQARINQTISTQNLLIKILDVENFKRNHGHLGKFLKDLLFKK